MIDQKTFKDNIFKANNSLKKKKFDFDLSYQIMLITNSFSNIAILVKQNENDLEHPAIKTELNKLKVYSYQLFAGMLDLNTLPEDEQEETFKDLYEVFVSQEYVDQTIEAIYDGDKVKALNDLLIYAITSLGNVENDTDYTEAVSNLFSLQFVISEILKQK